MEVRDGVRVIRFDLGNLDLTAKPGEFVSPLRGTLVVPDAPASPAALVVVNHLRSFGCTGATFAYPCPAGSSKLRLDRGMEYLGVALAKTGRAVLIPDLSPAFVAVTSTSNYPQAAAIVTINTVLRDKVLAASASASDQTFGPGLAGAVAAGRSDLVTHSRSGLFAPDLIAAWASGPTPSGSQFALAPAYSVGGTFTPAPPDIPYLVLGGDADDDVPYHGNLLLTEHLGAARTTPALAVLARGYGHNPFNSALRNDDSARSTTCPAATSCVSP